MGISLRTMVCCTMAWFGVAGLRATENLTEKMEASLTLKVPGNNAVEYKLTASELSGGDFDYEWKSLKKLPMTLFQNVSLQGNKLRITVFLTALQDVWFNYEQWIGTSFRHDECQFYLPGFWYRRNLRSPEQAPSFYTSDSWTVREDRLSAPLTGVFNEKSGEYITVARIDRQESDALATHSEGEIVLSGTTTIGFTGFENHGGVTSLAFGFPYRETPRTYIRKLTLAPPVTAFQSLKKGETLSLTWEICREKEADFSGFVSRIWEYCYDTYRPQVVETPYTLERTKEVLSHYFTQSFVKTNALSYYSGVHLRTDDCKSTGTAEVGFVGRVLLNAFNAWEYGWQCDRRELREDASKVFESYLEHGFSAAGFLKEFVDYRIGYNEPVHSIRRQSEGIYALFHFLDFERKSGRKHPEWELKMRNMLDIFLTLQNPDGSFPRKFKDDFSLVDESGGSTPSATLPLVMGYKYFKDKRYLESARRTVAYLEREIISKSDYFSSTLDANCEDKEASLYAATATYYMALVTHGKEQQHYAELTKKAAYFALSWYYLWDVPFAPGQMLGDIGLKTRGWGNVSVENNHIDVFVFEFASVLNWLSKKYQEPRFSEFAKVISTSMRQLLPYEGHLCGVAKRGYYPEVVQHTNWDYGKNGKGYYNDIFAPGWTVASLWELFSPGRAEAFLNESIVSF